jgi:hypothetical protein
LGGALLHLAVVNAHNSGDELVNKKLPQAKVGDEVVFEGNLEGR